MNVLIATDDPKTAHRLNMLVEQCAGATAHTCVDAHGLQRQVRCLQPELILLDWELGGRPAAALLFALDRVCRGPACPWPTGQWTTGRWPAVIVLSDCPEIRPIALACGAAAFVLKREAGVALVSTMRRLTGEKTCALGAVAWAT